MKMKTAVPLAVAILFMAHSAASLCQQYPIRPIRMIVGFTPGGGTDTVARVVGAKLAEQLGQSVVIDNRPGAGGDIATVMVAKSVLPDGYSLLMASGSHTINPSLHKQQYRPVEDFAPISQLARSQYLLVSVLTVPATSVKELIALAKSKPGELNFGSAGNGTPPHLALELLKSMTGTNMVHVPFKGTAPVTTALLSNQVQLNFANLGAILPLVRAGRLRGLAVSGLVRSAAAPEFPTIAESGLAGFEATGWYGVLAPAGTASQIVNKLYKELVQALESRGVKDRLATEGLESVGSTPKEFAATIEAEVAKWAKVVKFAGMKID